ncbi:thioredoxin-dependent thiol peroxidase [Pseudoroseicyclus aestuarii]|uniref:thioredoxin-dependent peroxiredoxin n=1 Tax=Pseudoroseicyclus aestuarii TaxID=1795041 RepID=A0A318SW22_9RHOB|nr:thioredoxin-dependent thiol peroxidase [Pseudoroseicyclus aestuarii]PYE85793.1 peroxiredoxin Q/BCP [Pseudoroseicyclus aestuarii]
MPQTAETLATGDEAPDFTLPADDGGSVTLSALRGAPVVLYFYPRDDTPGCTTEAQDFTALQAEFAAAGIRVLGVSRDSVAKHGRFRDKHGLKVTLLADEEAEVCQSYGVWVEKNMYGKTSMGIERSTFLIAADGGLARIWRKVKVPGHAQEVLEAARAI